MFSIDLSNIEIQKTLISGLFSILNTVIAAVTASLIGKTIVNRRRLQEKLETAISDIEFLLEVERSHCDNNKHELGESRKNVTREAVKSSGFSFSGRFTPGRVRSMRSSA
jgi:hypothetical protein